MVTAVVLIQCEIDLMPQPLVGSADQVMLARYIIRNVARRLEFEVYIE